MKSKSPLNVKNSHFIPQSNNVKNYLQLQPNYNDHIIHFLKPSESEYNSIKNATQTKKWSYFINNNNKNLDLTNYFQIPTKKKKQFFMKAFNHEYNFGKVTSKSVNIYSESPKTGRFNKLIYQIKEEISKKTPRLVI